VPTQNQALLLAGRGIVTFHRNVRIGVSTSPKFWSSECYIEARSASAKVEIGQNCLIGHDVFSIDSDFHHLDPDKRNIDPGSESIKIGNNVFIGSYVKILKNVCIGDSSVVASGAVVSGTFPARSLIAGNPAELIRIL
jgi:acetyltransferase-like isoleucine patch superfamily enzyme